MEIYAGPNGPTGGGPKKRSWFRRFLWRLTFLGLVFGAGLGLGLVEDYEAEELVGGVKAALDKPRQRLNYVQWRHVWENYDQRTTQHFDCRAICRKVGFDEIDEAVSNGYLIDYVEQDCREDGYDFKYTVEGSTSSNRELVVVFSASPAIRMLKLITVWEVGKDYDCPKDC